jgi:hypothetical protein
MSRWVREPLLHFLAIGALLFALDAWVNGPGASDPSAIRVDQAQANALAVQFERTWQRPADASGAAAIDRCVDRG